MSTQVIVREKSEKTNREFHLPGKTLNSQVYTPWLLPLYDDDKPFSSLTSEGTKLAEAVVTKMHNGEIERITFREHSMSVEISGTTSWAEVEEAIIMPAIEAVYGAPLKIVQFYRSAMSTTRQAATA